MTAAADTETGADPPPQPFGDAELQNLFRSFSSYPHVALAVSGGADSIALMHLTRAWLDLPRENLTQITVLTVDHQLRARSSVEADWVGWQASLAGFRAEVLRWEGDKPTSGLQAGARAARYALMTGYCREHAIRAVATAHTLDDQAETLIMRLARGSGVDGLAGMAAASRRGEIVLLRPLLGIARARLEAPLKAKGRLWVEDPSNADERFERVRVRRQLKAAELLGLSRGKLALSAQRLSRAREALDAMTTAVLSANLTRHAAGFGEIPLDALQKAPEEIVLRALSRLTHAYGGGVRAPQLSKIEAYWRQSRSGGAPTATLGGCLLRLRGARLMVAREFGRMETREIPVQPGPIALWDGRFDITIPPDDAALFLRPLGRDGIACVKTASGSFPGIPAIVAETLPSLWSAGQLRFTPFAEFGTAPPANWLADGRVRFANTSILSAQPIRITPC